MGKNIWKNVYVTELVCYTPETNIIDQVYFNKKIKLRNEGFD